MRTVILNKSINSNEFRGTLDGAALFKMGDEKSIINWLTIYDVFLGFI